MTEDVKESKNKEVIKESNYNNGDCCSDNDIGSIPNLFEKRIIVENSPEQTKTSIIVDGKAVKNLSDIFENNKYLFSNTEVFPNGENDAYFITVKGNTSLIGNTTLKNWLGTWQRWEDFIYPNEEITEQYTYLDEVWKLAYQSYITTLQSVGIDMTAKMPNTEALKKYWYTISTTKGVKKLEITGNNTDGYCITWKDSNDKILASDNYVMTGKMLKGFEGAPAYVFTAQNLAKNSDYKYFISMYPGMSGTEETPIAAHFHFQFGKSLYDILLKGELYNSSNYGKNKNGRPINSNLKNNNWYATMVNANASKLENYNVILGMHKVKKWSKLPDNK